MPGASTFTRVAILGAWDETPALRAIRADLGPRLAGAHCRPGQVTKIHAGGADAYFALASAPAADGHVDLLVKRGGPVADAVIAQAAPGGDLELTAPFGEGFPVEEARGKDVLLFASGSAIGPIRSLVQHILANRRDFGRVTLFYGQRRGGEFAYAREHLDWERGGVRVVLCPSQEADAWQGVRGRVQEVARSLAFGGAPPGEAVAFVCGMHAMVADVRATLARAGVPADRVHVNF